MISGIDYWTVSQALNWIRWRVWAEIEPYPPDGPDRRRWMAENEASLIQPELMSPDQAERALFVGLCENNIETIGHRWESIPKITDADSTDDLKSIGGLSAEDVLAIWPGPQRVTIPRMTLLQAAALIATGTTGAIDKEFIDSLYECDRGGSSLWETLECCRVLRDVLRCKSAELPGEALVAHARDPLTSRSRDMFPWEWQALDLVDPRYNDLILESINPHFTHNKLRWTAVTVRAEDVPKIRTAALATEARNLALHRPSAMVANFSAQSLVGQPTFSTAPTLAPDPAPESRKPPVSEAALKNWYINRRDTWPAENQHPSADRDLRDAKVHFEDNRVSRDQTRSLRSEHAPTALTALGRRPGKAKNNLAT